MRWLMGLLTWLHTYIHKMECQICIHALYFYQARAKQTNIYFWWGFGIGDSNQKNSQSIYLSIYLSENTFIFFLRCRLSVSNVVTLAKKHAIQEKNAFFVYHLALSKSIYSSFFFSFLFSGFACLKERLL